jgi:8-oxo-dGTP diphosphatase
MMATVATLAYVMSPDRGRVLLIHRDARSDDHHFGKYNGLGGKIEPGEDVCACARREVLEESGLECDRLDLAGTMSFPGIGPQGDAWFIVLFRIHEWSGELVDSNREGHLVWVRVDDVLQRRIPMWDGDYLFLSLVFAPDPKPFHGVMPYSGGRHQSWSYTES